MFYFQRCRYCLCPLSGRRFEDLELPSCWMISEKFYHKETYLTCTDLVVFKGSFPKIGGNSWTSYTSSSKETFMAYHMVRNPVPRVPFFCRLAKWLNTTNLRNLMTIGDSPTDSFEIARFKHYFGPAAWYHRDLRRLVAPSIIEGETKTWNTRLFLDLSHTLNTKAS